MTASPAVAAGRLRSLLAAAVEPAGRAAVRVRFAAHEVRFVASRARRRRPIVDVVADVAAPDARSPRVGDCDIRAPRATPAAAGARPQPRGRPGRLTVRGAGRTLAARAHPVTSIPRADPRPSGSCAPSGWTSRTVKEELRANLLARLAAGPPDRRRASSATTRRVLPAIENAIVAGQDLVFLGERGQAKTRMARLLVGLLDECAAGRPRRRAQRRPDRPDQPEPAGRSSTSTATPPRSTGCPATGATRRSSRRPDITIADLIGEVDPIRVAEGRYLSDELTLHYGLIPRSNRGIFAINELPDLAERIQVGLLNILEERDVQIRGFTVRLPLDLFVVASANPEDYTIRGRIITPLKDRLGSQVRTHYPRTLDHELAIVRQEKQRFVGARRRAGRSPSRRSWRSSSPS